MNRGWSRLYCRSNKVLITMMIALFDVDIAFCVIMIEPKEHVWDRTKEKQQQRQRQLLFGFFRRVFLVCQARLHIYIVPESCVEIADKVEEQIVECHHASSFHSWSLGLISKSRKSEFCEKIQSFLMNFARLWRLFLYVACYIFILSHDGSTHAYWYWNVPHAFTYYSHQINEVRNKNCLNGVEINDFIKSLKQSEILIVSSHETGKSRLSAQ